MGPSILHFCYAEINPKCVLSESSMYGFKCYYNTSRTNHLLNCPLANPQKMSQICIIFIGYNFEIHRKTHGITFWFDNQSILESMKTLNKKLEFPVSWNVFDTTANSWKLASNISWSNYNELIQYVLYLGYNFEIHRKPYGINFPFDNQSTILTP